MLVRPMPTSSVSELLTPGTSVASCTKLRLLSGSSSTWVAPIRVCTAGVGWIIVLAPTTSTTSLSSPTDERRVDLEPVVHVQLDAPWR